MVIMRAASSVLGPKLQSSPDFHPNSCLRSAPKQAASRHFASHAEKERSHLLSAEEEEEGSALIAEDEEKKRHNSRAQKTHRSEESERLVCSGHCGEDGDRRVEMPQQ